MGIEEYEPDITPNTANSNIIWIDPNIDNTENAGYRKEMNSIGFRKVKCFKNIKEAIDYLKQIQFEETKIIISGKLYIKFLDIFIRNFNEINVIPKIIIFTRQKKLFINQNEKYKEYINHSYYNFGGIQTSFIEIKNFILNKNQEKSSKITQDTKKISFENKDNIQMTFKYIDKKNELILHLFYKILLEEAKNDQIENYTNFIYKEYSKENKNIYNLMTMTQIISLKNIPIELLSKYYIRAYTIDSKFYPEINRDLRNDKTENHLAFIKTLYEGTKLKSLPLASNNELFRGAKIANDEIINIKEYLKKKLEDLPAAIVFSKSFLSFTKERKIAEKFLGGDYKNDKLSKVLFILKKDDNLDYSLATHADIEKISFYPKEREVLFYPFSSFEIKGIREINFNKENIYEIKLLYLSKYLKEIEKDKNIIGKENIIPDTEFKKQVLDSGLILPEKIKNNNTKKIFQDYKKYKNDIDTPRKHIIESKNNYIIGEVYINNENTTIRIINSYENDCRINSYYINKEYENEKEIKKNIEILINDKKIDFSYEYKFEQKGKYIIKYIFKQPLTKTDYMFCGCSSLKKIDLSNFNTQNVINMSDMFHGCSSLKNIDLSNFNTQNVTDMSYMFCGCSSLKNIDLSNFNTQNITYMIGMFSGCSSLANIVSENNKILNEFKKKNDYYIF